ITRLALDTARAAGGLGPLEGHMRAGFLLPLSDDTTALRVEFSHGFEDHSDERLRLPLHGSFAGEALAAGRALIVERNDLAKWNRSLSRPEDRWVRKMVWSEARWLICIPFCHTPSDTKLVLAIDGNRDLALASKLLEPTLTSLSDHLVTMLDKGLPKELFEW
ncbi:MAG: hypothetical protein QOJ27_8, partial [Sphingomonadales bacterium]|nr:hypothetical protein [Sphingomonadales bacterium]